MKNLQLVYRRGIFISYDNFTLKYDQYVEVAPGIKDKLLRHNNHIIPKGISNMIQKGETIIHAMLDPNVEMDEHYHREAERIYCLNGIFRDNTTGRVYRPHDIMEIEPYQSHKIESIGPCEQIIMIYPGLPFIH